MEPLEGSRKAALAQSIELVPDQKRPMGFQVRRRHRSRFSEQLILRMALRDTPPRSGNLDLRLLAEGDSWCNLLWPVSGYPKTLVDVLSEQYYTVNLGWPGDTFKKSCRSSRTSTASRCNRIPSTTSSSRPAASISSRR